MSGSASGGVNLPALAAAGSDVDDAAGIVRMGAGVSERPVADKDASESLTTAAELETMLREYWPVRDWAYREG